MSSRRGQIAMPLGDDAQDVTFRRKGEEMGHFLAITGISYTSRSLGRLMATSLLLSALILGFRDILLTSPAYLKEATERWCANTNNDHISPVVGFARYVTFLKYMNPVPPAYLRPPQGPMAKKVNDALASGKVHFQVVNYSLGELLKHLQASAKVPFLLDVKRLGEAGISPDTHVNIVLKESTLVAGLQKIEAKLARVQFVVRDYGILLTTKDNAERNKLFLATGEEGKSK